MALWSELYRQENQPTFEEVEGFVQNALWGKVNSFLREEYKIPPKMEYSKCAAQRGWNIKYKKGSKNLCTLYPMEGYYILLLVVNEKMQAEAELVVSDCCDHIKELYQRTRFLCGGKWLMIHITNERIFEDVMKLIRLRAKLG